MKAYPLIYSRTKNVDFVPDFLARPADIDVNTALRYVADAMKSLDGFDGIRYSTFESGDYYICGGISCLTKHLFEQVKQENRILVSSSDEEYLKDCKGRNTAVFIGFAINRKDIVVGKIPDISLSEYWSVYLEHLKKQWDSCNTESEEILIPDVELNEKTYTAPINIDAEKIGNKYAIKNFNNNKQNILEYFYDLIMNRNTKMSFISDVRRKNDWDNCDFTYISVDEDLLTAIKSNPIPTASNPYHIKTGNSNDSSKISTIGYGKSAYKQNISNPSANAYGKYGGITSSNKSTTSYNESNVSSSPEKKKNIRGTCFIVIGLIILLIIICIVLVNH